MKKIITFVLFIFLLQACTANVYVATTHHVPLLKEKGNLSGGFFTSSTGVDIQLAYALNNNIGIGSSFNYLNDRSQNNDQFQKHKYGEIAFIYFLNPIRMSVDARQLFSNQAIPDRYIKIEFLGSIGVGEGESQTSDNIYAIGRYVKYSAQSNIAFMYESAFVGVSPKLSYVSYYDFTFTEPLESDKANAVFWEPALFAGLQIENLRLQAQWGFTRVLGEEPAFFYGNNYLSVGLQINLNVLD